MVHVALRTWCWTSRRAPTSPKTLYLNLGFARDFAWTFEMADVSWPFNFLHYFGVLVKVRHKRLIDHAAYKSVEASSVDEVSVYTIKVISFTHKWTTLLNSFPSVTRESPVPDKFLHLIQHELHTTVVFTPTMFTSRPLWTYQVRIKFEFMRFIYQPSFSALASHLLLVTKKDGHFQPCGDYQRLNEVTCANHYPLASASWLYF